MTFDLHIWHSDSQWLSIGHILRSVSLIKVKFTGRNKFVSCRSGRP